MKLIQVEIVKMPEIEKNRGEQPSCPRNLNGINKGNLHLFKHLSERNYLFFLLRRRIKWIHCNIRQIIGSSRIRLASEVGERPHIASRTASTDVGSDWAGAAHCIRALVDLAGTVNENSIILTLPAFVHIRRPWNVDQRKIVW